MEAQTVPEFLLSSKEYEPAYLGLYPNPARRAIREMHKRVGELKSMRMVLPNAV